ncbi:hypothetical protein B23_0921 [Geobacillus thermoleovorans B23]|nr:hypothetical protein B23_0921 [Geobacillus thermoleovorans B23]
MAIPMFPSARWKSAVQGMTFDCRPPTGDKADG